MKYSIIIPVYNRPNEVNELLSSLTEIETPDFEVIIVDDGSTQSCREIALDYAKKLEISYHSKENSGQGFTRNWAAKHANGQYLVFFDSDCLIPPTYFLEVENILGSKSLDAWGGPDMAHQDFNLLQRSIGYTMSATLTTGGIRGKKSHIGKFQPRTYNMGIKLEIFKELGGFAQTNMGEDIELSTRIVKNGFTSELIEDAFVYHKRRDTLGKFINQAYRFGKSRVMNNRKNPGSMKLVHLLPFFFLLGLFVSPLTYFLHPASPFICYGIYAIYLFFVAVGGVLNSKNILVGLLSIPVAFFQLTAYGAGIFGALLSNKTS